MAEEKIERTYNIPLRRDWLHVPKYKRAKKAIRAIREFLSQHMKVPEKEVKIGKAMNDYVWDHGMKNPPHHVKVIVIKDKDGKVSAELVGAAVEKKDAKKAKPVKAEEKAEKAEKAEEKKPEATEAEIVSEEKPKPAKPKEKK
jgi:large subunit ribosomal protein L31e